MIKSLQKKLDAKEEESRYWRQTVEELKSQQADAKPKLERERHRREASEERAEQLALQVAQLNARLATSAATSARALEQHKMASAMAVAAMGDGERGEGEGEGRGGASARALAEEVAMLPAHQKDVLGTQGGIGKVLESYLKTRRRMAKMQAVYQDLKTKVNEMERNGMDAQGFENLRSVSELEYDLEYMTNKRNAAEAKYAELKRRMGGEASDKRALGLGTRSNGKENAMLCS